MFRHEVEAKIPTDLAHFVHLIPATVIEESCNPDTTVFASLLLSDVLQQAGEQLPQESPCGNVLPHVARVVDYYHKISDFQLDETEIRHGTQHSHVLLPHADQTFVFAFVGGCLAYGDVVLFSVEEIRWVAELQVDISKEPSMGCEH